MAFGLWHLKVHTTRHLRYSIDPLSVLLFDLPL